jgi:N-methylhydantoinase A
VHFDGEWHETPIYERSQLAPGHTLTGPAIVEQEDSTSVIEPGWVGTVDDAGNITVRRQG